MGKRWIMLNDRSMQSAIKGDRAAESRVLTEYILNYWNSGKIKESEDSARKALTIQGLGEEEKSRFADILRIHQLYNAAKDLRLKSDFEASIKSFQEAIGISKLLAIPDFELKCLRQLSVCYWDQNDYDEFNTSKSTRVINSTKIEKSKRRRHLLEQYWHLLFEN